MGINMFKNLSDAKRKLKIGSKLKLIWALYPNKLLQVEREIVKVQTNAIAFNPILDQKGPSYLTWPRANDFIPTENGFKIYESGGPILEYEVISCGL